MAAAPEASAPGVASLLRVIVPTTPVDELELKPPARAPVLVGVGPRVEARAGGVAVAAFPDLVAATAVHQDTGPSVPAPAIAAAGIAGAGRVRVLREATLGRDDARHGGARLLPLP